MDRSVSKPKSNMQATVHSQVTDVPAVTPRTAPTRRGLRPSPKITVASAKSTPVKSPDQKRAKVNNTESTDSQPLIEQPNEARELLSAPTMILGVDTEPSSEPSESLQIQKAQESVEPAPFVEQPKEYPDNQLGQSPSPKDTYMHIVSIPISYNIPK